MTMATNEQKRWREISRHLDEALDLDDQARASWLRALDDRAPTISAAVRSLIAEKERLPEQPLLNEQRTVALPRPGLAGQQVGAYTLECVLGTGGMGTVWLARRSDGRYEGRAAMKLLNAALLGRPTEQRFVREGSVLAKLRHPNIAQLIDAGVAPSGQPYLVLEYVEGERIDRHAEQRNLDIEARVRLFLDVIAAVSHAHSHLIVHRDIKPSNILVTPDGLVKLLDFGIAALLGPDDAELTREVEPGLTPEYAAPEQLLKQPVTTATDVYALGVVLFLLLTGKHPLNPDGTASHELARATLDRDIPRPSQLAADPALGRMLRGDLDNIIGKALKRDPSERYNTAEALAQDLRCFLASKPVSAQPDSIAYRASKFIRRHRGGVIASAIIALVLIGATLLTTLQMIEARRQRDAALYQSKRAEFQARFAYQIMSEVGGDGGPVTIRQLMEKGVEVLEKSYRDDPRFVIGMLVNISGRYMNMGDTNGEYAALVRAERLARQLGDPERIAYVQCNTVETELAAGRPKQARERMRDGLANLARLPDPPLDRQTECGTAQARLLWSEGRLPEAIESATKIARLIEARNETDDLAYGTLTTMLQVMLGAEGRRREAREWNRRLLAVIERSEGGSSLSMSNARTHEASHLHDAGEIRAALNVQRAVVERIASQQGVDSVPASFAHRLGLYQIRIEETDAGLVWLDRAVAASAARNERRVQIGALINRAQAHLLLGRLEGVLADIEAAERLAEGNPDEHRAALRDARFIRSQLLVARGKPAAAIGELDAVLAEIGYPGKRVANQLAPMLILKARAQLSLGRNSAALTTARDALAIAEANAPQPDRSAIVGAALMTIAAAQRADDGASARAAAKRASAALSNGLGPAHSETRAALLFH
ncbi:MAG: protein kinase domain-containing protein [Steroidobacter sp.]